MAITEADAPAMAMKSLDPALLQVVAIDHSEGVARALRKLGPVEL